LQLPFIGRDKEKLRVVTAVQQRESLLVLGAAGMGKTRLFSEALPSGEALYMRWETSLHSLLVMLARALIAAEHTAFLDRAKPTTNVDAWLGAQQSVHLKGLLWNALQAAPALVILDGITGCEVPRTQAAQFKPRSGRMWCPSKTNVVSIKEVIGFHARLPTP
jgi:hypothetical protein